MCLPRNHSLLEANDTAGKARETETAEGTAKHALRHKYLHTPDPAA
jgi:hypothetical protein